MDKILQIAIDTISIPQQFIAKKCANHKRNGFTGDFSRPTPHKFLSILEQSNAETLLKTNQIEVSKRLLFK
jgi:hypothetical protein